MTRTPTEFGYWLMQRMARPDINLNQMRLARATGVSQSTISRWIYEQISPTDAKLSQLAAPLKTTSEHIRAAAGGNPDAAPDIADQIRAELAEARDNADPIAVEVGILLGASSPLKVDERILLRELLDRVVAPHRKLLRRRG